MAKPRFKFDHRSKRLIPIQELPYGYAFGFNEFSNRGLDGEEITVWPKRLHYRLTTGAESHRMGQPEPVKLDEYEKQMCAILGLAEEELGIFLRSWEPTDKQRPRTTREMGLALNQSAKRRKD